METRLGTLEELIEEKLIKIEEATKFHDFESGILFSLEVTDVEEDKFKFHGEKYRSPLGAYSFYDCTATKIDEI